MWAIPVAVALATAAASVYNADRQRKADKKALQQQNEYNSPASQMRRLQEAGLNPNLVYGGGNVTGNQSGLLKQDYSRDADAMQNALTTFMAIDNHDKDMQMKGEEILDMQHKNDLFNATFEYQKAKSQMESRVLQAQQRIAEYQQEAWSHNMDIMKKNYPNMLWNTTGHTDSGNMSMLKDASSVVSSWFGG